MTTPIAPELIETELDKAPLTAHEKLSLYSSFLREIDVQLYSVPKGGIADTFAAFNRELAEIYEAWGKTREDLNANKLRLRLETSSFSGNLTAIYTLEEPDELPYELLLSLANEHAYINTDWRDNLVLRLPIEHTYTKVVSDITLTINFQHKFEAPLPPVDAEVLWQLGKVERKHSSGSSYLSLQCGV